MSLIKKSELSLRSICERSWPQFIWVLFYFITLLTTMNPVSWGGWPPNFCCTVVLLTILLLNLLRPLIFYDLLALTAKTAVCLPGLHAATARHSAALWTSKWVQKNLEEKLYFIFHHFHDILFRDGYNNSGNPNLWRKVSFAKSPWPVFKFHKWFKWL